MITAIMQPYLFPYIGYWQLINAVDTFVIYDNIKFSKNGWFHRNNILLNGEKKLFSIPLKKDLDTLNVVDRFLSIEARKIIYKTIRQIEFSYKKAPCFKTVFPVIEKIFQNNEQNLFRYIYYSVLEVCEYLEINTNIVISSSIDIDHSLKSQDKVIALNKALKSRTYINSIGGISLYDFNEFKKENIDLYFLESELENYKQFSYEFVPYLSIIDVMMFNTKCEIKEMLGKYKLRVN